MEDYQLFLKSNKQMEMPIIVQNVKRNHSSSLFYEQELSSGLDFGDVTFSCEIRERNQYDYSFLINSSKISNRVVARFDEGNGTHRNNISEIPLTEQSVTTPHFHRYDSEGRLLAYKNPVLKMLQEKHLNIKDGLMIFCNEENIIGKFNLEPDIVIKEDGAIPFEFANDPLDGVNF